jgi:predicted O-methyltransferase YrrM
LWWREIVVGMEDLVYITPPGMVSQILEQTQALNFAMGSEALTGALLKTLAASKPGARVLELGTGTGLATAWLLDGMDHASRIISVDTDLQAQEVARRFLGKDPRLQLVNMDGISFLRTQNSRSFDLVFADALPGKYEGLELALEVVARGGFYVIDDMLPQANWPPGHSDKVPVLMQELAERKDFIMIPLAWASGIVLAVRTS